MTQTAPATPCLAKVPLDADRQAYALLIVHADRAIAPQPALRQVVEFESTPHGGFISAAQAHDGGWGYINEQGQWLVPPTLNNARGFTEDGVARFCRAGRWGYLNLLGQEVIAPQFDDARPMRNGLAAVKTGPHAWRIIDLQGQFTCAATFADLGNFGAVGLAPAQPWDPDRDLPLWGYVDHRGQWVVAPRFAQAHSFDEQAVAAVSANGKTWGLINAQGQWVLQPCHARMDAFNSEALAYYADADAATGGPCGYLNTRGKVAVNISARQLGDPQFLEQVMDILRAEKLPADLLEIELTETVLMENMEAGAHTLHRLSQLGIHLAIDDFGTGYSSLAYLRQLPMRRLKIDRSFVRDLPAQEHSRKIVTAILALAHGLGLEVTAEGVETLEQAEYLVEQGCDVLQGYAFARPMPVQQFVELQASH